jgi:cephalosporin hydroxylase
MNPNEEFVKECKDRVSGYAGRPDLLRAGAEFMAASTKAKYSYNFRWMGRPIIQYPQDIVAMQELIWQVKPDLIIETGVAHGGSLVFYASMLDLLHGGGIVIGIDIEVRPHNRESLESHPMFGRIRLLEGSSVDDRVFRQVREMSKDRKTVMVVLDSNHTYAHVKKELELYAPLVTRGSYCVVFDTIIEDVPGDTYPDRPWGIGNNPKTAVREFLAQNKDFAVEREIHEKLLVTVAPDGYLKRVR